MFGLAQWRSASCVPLIFAAWDDPRHCALIFLFLNIARLNGYFNLVVTGVLDREQDATIGFIGKSSTLSGPAAQTHSFTPTASLARICPTPRQTWHAPRSKCQLQQHAQGHHHQLQGRRGLVQTGEAQPWPRHGVCQLGCVIAGWRN
jgi:hypothetical protein